MSTVATVRRTMARQYGVISRPQATAAGLTPSQVDRHVRSGRWLRVHPGVYRSAEIPRSPEGDLVAAVLATNGRASHQSAGWLWGLVDDAPRPTVTVGASSSNVRPGIIVHRVEPLIPTRPGVYRHIPCTAPLRTVLDLAAVFADGAVDDVVDRVIARRLVPATALARAVDDPVMRHRRGRARLVGSLRRLGTLDGPPPSVLESKVARLLRGVGIHPIRREQTVVWEGGRYRLDYTLADWLALEVDGYTYHSGPAAFRRDLQRRTRLARMGWTVLAYSWVEIVEEGPRVVAEVREALAVRCGRGGPVARVGVRHG